MAQTQSLTKLGYGEIGKLLSCEASKGFKSVCCLKTACTADEDQTSGGVTKCTDAGLILADAATVASAKTTVDNDTVQVDHKFTEAGAGETVLGFGVWNDDDDVLMGLCCFAAGVVMAATDTLTVQWKTQVKAD